MNTVPMTPRPGRRTLISHAYAVGEEARPTIASERVDRKTLLRAADHAGRALGLRNSVRSILGILCAIYSEQQLPSGLLVWPSNRYLQDKSGLSERAVRYAIRRLREEGLVRSIDSPNGKRFARWAGDRVTQAFGFDLAPLYARREAFAAEVASAEKERSLVRALHHDLSAIHRDLMDLAAALADLDLRDLSSAAEADIEATRPRRIVGLNSTMLAEFMTLAEVARSRAEKAFYEASKKEEFAGNGGTNCRHKESNTDLSIENCQFEATEEEKGQGVHFNEEAAESADGDVGEEWRETYSHRCAPPKALFDVALWKSACPILEDFAQIRSIEDVAGAGSTMARLLQVAPHGLERWKKQLGPALFQLVAVYVYQTFADDQAKIRPEIRKPGGFFCHVAREIVEGVRDLPRELMALQRKRRRLNL